MQWMEVGVLCFWCINVLRDVLTSYCENLFFSEVGCLWEFISLCFILWEFISPLVFLWGWLYLYFPVAFAYDALGDVPLFLVDYFGRCSFELILKFVTFFQDEVLCWNERMSDCIPLVCLYVSYPNFWPINFFFRILLVNLFLFGF
jgi:hypothetical protein